MQPIPPPQRSKQEHKQARQARRQAFWGHLWHELVRMEFITSFGDWLEEFLARVVEKLALFSAIYLIVEVGVPAISFQNIHETAMGIILASPELIMVGAFKIAAREIRAGNSKAWGLMVCVFLLLLLTVLTVLELMVWHWSAGDVNKLLAVRFLASIAYTFCHGILKESDQEPPQALSASTPATDLEPALREMATRLREELSAAQTHTMQQVDSLSRKLDTLSSGYLSTEQQMSTRLAMVDQSLDTLDADLSRLVQQVSTFDTRLKGVEAHEGEQLASIHTTLREIQSTGRMTGSRSHQDTDHPSLSRPRRTTRRQEDVQQGDGLDSQQGETSLDSTSGVDPLSRQSTPTGKIIRLSSLGTRSRQPMMTERVLAFIRANHREPSLGEIQSWGCAKQTAVNSRDAARAILRQETSQPPPQPPEVEQVGNDQ